MLADCPFDHVALAKPRPGTEYLGSYRLIERLAVGGMGAVYRALHEKSGRSVAIKLLHQSLRNEVVSVSRFFHEARAVNTIRHPNVVEVYDLSGEGEDVYMVLELLRGKDLRTLLGEQAGGCLKADRVVGILEQVCGALQASHARKIVHRDLKPENIFLTNKGGRIDFVKLLDFGVAKLERPEGRLTREGIALGTPEYMAPEQARGADVDARTDVYAVGCIAYEMLTGRTVFHGATPGETMIKQVREAPRPPRELNPSVPESLQQVVLRCLSKAPKARPQSAMELAQELCNAVGSEFDGSGAFMTWKGWDGPSSTSMVEMPAVTVRAHRPSQMIGAVRTVVKGHRRATVAIAAAAVCVALLTWMGLRGGRQAAAPPIMPPVTAVLRPALTPITAVEVLVRTTPPGAQIFDESGRNLGVTPRTLSLPPGGARTLRFERRGYRTIDGEVRADAPGGALEVVLEPTSRAKKRQSRTTSHARR
jgi:eukaryotic-like serine/threonine-protein kinase